MATPIQVDSGGRPVAIRLEHVSKRYRAGRSRTVVDLIGATLDRMRGHEHEIYSVKRGKINATVHALRDVTFDVAEGTGLGIIGPNGAGKTTLLKLISRVTWPTSGRVACRPSAWPVRWTKSTPSRARPC